MTMKEQFMEVLTEAAGKRYYFNDLVEWLESTDFFEAPASTKYHGCYEGGLLEHTMNVYHRIMKYDIEYIKAGGNRDSLAIAALLHDVCKIGNYIKQEDGKYTYNRDIALPVGHGERSVILIQQTGFTLTLEEITAIRWHMGGWDNAVRGGCQDQSAAYRRYKLAVMLHLADMEATYLDEKEG